MKVLSKRVMPLLISFILLVTMAISLAPQTVFADDSAITSLEVADLEIYEGTCLCSCTETDQSGQSHTYDCYALENSAKLLMTVVYNGKTISGTVSEIVSTMSGMAGFWEWPTFNTGQTYNSQWEPGKTYPVTVEYLGQTAEFNVTLLESPITSFSVENLEIIENTTGFMDQDYSGETPSEEYFRYVIDNSSDLRATIKVNGEEFSGSPWDIHNYLQEKLGEDLYLEFDTNQSYENQWTSGNTYQVKANLMGLKTDFEVTIKKNPLTSVAVKDLEMKEGLGGYQTSDYGDPSLSYFRYEPINSRDLQLTIVYDGKEYTGSFYEIQSILYQLTGEYPDIYSTDEQSYQNQWTVGNKYLASLKINGIEAFYNVTIVESPIESLQVNDCTISEGAYVSIDYDSNNETFLSYNLIYNTTATLTIDKKEYTGTLAELNSIIYQLLGEYSWPEITSNQSAATPWTAGNTYDVSISWLGLSDTFKVTVKESPFASIEVADMQLIEEADGYFSSSYVDGKAEKYFVYSFTPTVKVTTKKGEELSSSDSIENGITYEGEQFPVICQDDQNTMHWTRGTHAATAYLGGLTKNFQVEVLESPVQSLKVDPVVFYEKVSEFSYRNLFNYEITLKDGSKQSGNKPYYIYNGKTYWFNIVDYDYYSNWKAGETHTLKGQLLGAEADIPVEVKKLASIEVKEDNGLKLVLHQSDGETVEAVVHQFAKNSGADVGSSADGTLITDKGIFTAAIDNYYTGENVKFIIGGLESNVLASSKWVKVNQYVDKYSILAFMQNSLLHDLSFSGEVNKDNIDQMIKAAACFSNGDTSMFASIDADKMKEMIKEIFAVTSDFDMSLSSSFNSAANTVGITNYYMGGKLDVQVIATDTMQGFRFFSLEKDDYVTVEFDNSYKIQSVNPKEIQWKTEGVTKDYTGIAEDINGVRYYLVNGAVKKEGTKVVKVNGKSYYVVNGVVNEACTKSLQDGTINKLQDVNDGDWFFTPVIYAVSRKNNAGTPLMKGYAGETSFGPADPLTRGMFATILYRYENEPATVFDANKFPDVTNVKDFFATPAIWASQMGYIKGYDDGRFGATDNITREQLAVILFRYAQAKGYNITAKGDLSKFTDTSAISSWAKDPITWANGVGIISGKENKEAGTRYIDPQGKASRAECAAMLQRFIAYVEAQQVK